jgi:hypothetical protein
MNRSSWNNRKDTGSSNGGIDGPLSLPSLRMSIRICPFASILQKRGDSKCTKPNRLNERIKESVTVPLVDDIPQNHPSHVPTPTTLEGLCRDDVHEMIFDTIPTKFENFFSYYTSQDLRPKGLGSSFWEESAVIHRRENSDNTFPVSVKPVVADCEFVRTDITEASTTTVLQRQWEVENIVNLHQVISSRRILDNDLSSGNNG